MSRRSAGNRRFQGWFFRLNRRQARIFVLGVVLFVLATIVPPWQHEFRNTYGGTTARFARFDFVSMPPVSRGNIDYSDTGIAWDLLAVEWLGIVVATSVLMGVLRDRRRRPDVLHSRAR